MRFSYPLLLSLLLGPLASCAELPSIAPQGCGNRLIEPDSEDCDGPTQDGVCGEPGGSDACRFVCDTASAAPRGGCPASFACGLDGVCRQPSGRFVDAQATIQVPAEKLLASDLDADGHADLLALDGGADDALSPARVVYFNADGAADAIVSVPGGLARPTLLTLPDGELGAIVSSTFTGLATLLVQDDRSLLPHPYPSFPLDASLRSIRGAAFDILPPASDDDIEKLGDELVIAAQIEQTTSGETKLTNILAHTNGTSLERLADLPASPDTLRSGLLHGHLLFPKGPQHFCPDVVLAADGALSVSLLTPCITDSNGITTWNETSPPAVLDIDTSTINGPTFLVDANRDGLLDLVIGVSKGDDQLLRVAYGTGKGYLVPTPGSDVQNHSGPLWLPPLAAGDPSPQGIPSAPSIPQYGFPLAVGHFDQDNLLDFVVPGGVLISTNPFGTPDPGQLPTPAEGQGGAGGSPDGPGGASGSGGDGQGGGAGSGSRKEQPYHLIPFERAWSEVKLCDLNADGVVDLVAANGDDSSLDVLLGSGNGLFSNSSLALDGPAGALEVGDFDGDLIDDVVFRERSYDADGNLDDVLSVLFGARQGTPSEVVRMGRFGEIFQLAPGRLTLPGSIDQTSDLGLFSRKDSKFIASQLYGSSDRRLRSSYQLQTQPQGKLDYVIDQPGALVAARFAAGASPGLVALGVPQLFRLVDSPSSGPQDELKTHLWRLDIQSAAAVSQARSTTLNTLGFDGTLVAGDLDGDGADEIVLLQSAGFDIGFSGGTTTGAGSSGSGGSAGSSDVPTSALVFKLDDAGAYQQTAHEPFKVPVAIGSEAKLADLDNDGLLELILFNLDQTAHPPQILPGGTDLPGSSGSTGAAGSDNGDSTPTGSLFLVRQSSKGTFDWAHPSKIDLPSAQGLVSGFCVLGSLPGGSPRLAVLTEHALFIATLNQAGSFDVSPVDGIDGGVAVACADYDGDGIDDLATSSGDALQVFLGQPRLP